MIELKNLLKKIFIWNLSENALTVRLFLVIIIFLLCFLSISVRLFSLTVNVSFLESNNFINKRNMFRQDILDRNYNLVAVSLPTASLYANPRKVIDTGSLADKLLTVFPDLNKKKVLELLHANKEFVWIKRDVMPKQQQEIYNLGIPGLQFEREQRRMYTYGKLLSHIVGYVNRDMEGLAGAEKFFDQLLTSCNKNNNKHNFSLQLSIDIRVQNILEEEINKTIKNFKAKGGGGILVDPNNGEVIAMVSSPSFNPHFPGKNTTNQLFNMVTQGVYEIGSGIKSLTLAIGLDSGIISKNDAYNLSYMKVGKFKINDYHPLRGWHSIGQIFLHSSNIGVSQIMLEIGKDLLRSYLKKLKLLDKLEIELPERSRPLFLPYSKWNDLTLVTMSYGYSLSESPAHFIQAMIPVVNGGIIYPLTILKRKIGESIIGERIFKESTSRYMRQLMRLVVREGTAKKAELKGYYIGGKTGTAEKIVNGRYCKDKRISSFFGIMPATNPKYIIYIIIDEPQGIKETYGLSGGGWTAAPTAAAIFERIAVLYGINALKENDPEVQELEDIDYIIK